MAVIGITGSIASGKSTFRDILSPLLDAEVLDADLIARNLLECDPGVRARVATGISPDAYRADGSADRPKIRQIIYGDPAAKSRLEAILHPLVRAAWTGAALAVQKQGRHVIVDLPLLFETRAAEQFDFIITVACSPDVQYERLAARGMDRELAQSIISTQISVDEKIPQSTQVVWNDGNLDALDAQAKEFAALLRGGKPDNSP